MRPDPYPQPQFRFVSFAAALAAVCALEAASVAAAVDAAVGSPREIERISFDTAEGWTDSGQPEDKALSFASARGPGEMREGNGAIRLSFDREAGRRGMKHFNLPPVAGSDGCAFWVRGDESEALFQVRFIQKDSSVWDSPIIRIDFSGWRRIVIPRSGCVFRDLGGKGENWNDLSIFAVRFSARSCVLVLDDLRFYTRTARIKTEPRPQTGPLTLRIDLNDELPAIPDTMKGVDFALINWFASAEDNYLGPETDRLFLESSARLVRFWPFCPPLDVSRGPGEYNWLRFDAQMEKIHRAGAEVIMTCCFMPEWLSIDGSKEGRPANWEAYETLLVDTLHHCREQGWDVRYWEVWNEPDLTTGTRFLKGDLDDLCEIYSHFATAVRAANPHALVGGSGFARFNTEWLLGFLVYANKNELPLDFISWHAYELTPDGIAGTIRSARRYLAAFPRYNDVRLVIDEWQASGGPGNRFDTEYAAAYQAATFHRMVENGLDASVFFCFKESNWKFPRHEFGGSWGMITALNTPKASYHSFRIFAELDGKRVAVSGGDREIGAIAARRGKGLDVMLYRFQSEPTASDRVIRFDIAGWPGGKMDVVFELVDRKHSNPLFDPDIHRLERVGLWTNIEAKEFSRLDFRLEPLSVARIRIDPK